MLYVRFPRKQIPRLRDLCARSFLASTLQNPCGVMEAEMCGGKSSFVMSGVDLRSCINGGKRPRTQTPLMDTGGR